MFHLPLTHFSVDSRHLKIGFRLPITPLVLHSIAHDIKILSIWLFFFSNFSFYCKNLKTVAALFLKIWLCMGKAFKSGSVFTLRSSSIKNGWITGGILFLTFICLLPQHNELTEWTCNKKKPFTME